MDPKAFSDPDGVFYDQVSRLIRAGPYKNTVFEAAQRFTTLFIYSVIPRWIQGYETKGKRFFSLWSYYECHPQVSAQT